VFSVVVAIGRQAAAPRRRLVPAIDGDQPLLAFLL